MEEKIENLKLTQSLNGFALRLYKKLSKENVGNLVLSPYSVSKTLTMCYAGAKDETSKQLKELLNISSLTDEEIFELNKVYDKKLLTLMDEAMSLNTANKLYPNQDFELKQSFTNKIKKYFNGNLEQLNFEKKAESALCINNWVSKQTKGKIKDIVSANDLNKATKLILVNAIYFKARWAIEFDEESTRKDDFHLENGTVEQVDMMRLGNKRLRMVHNPSGIKGSICEISYRFHKASFLVILPDLNVKLDELEESLNANVINESLKEDFRTNLVNLYLPKFKFENKTELTETLIELGAEKAFNPLNSNFKGINSTVPVFISKVIHQTMIDVNEHGTEAAAATVAQMMVGCSRNVQIPEDFKCNRPFLFIIYDKVQNGILFIGKFTKP